MVALTVLWDHYPLIRALMIALTVLWDHYPLTRTLMVAPTVLWDHSFSVYVKFSEKLLFLAL